MKSYAFNISKGDARKRLDIYLFECEEITITRAQIKKRNEEGEIRVNGELRKSGYKLKFQDQIEWNYRPVRPLNAIAQNIKLDILFENKELAFINKPAGMVVHPAIGHPDGTLVNALLFHFSTLSKDPIRPGIVHRIDKDTSGVLVVAKTDEAHQKLGKIFREHDLIREYHAICFAPSLPDQGSFDTTHARDPKNRYRYSSKTGEGRRSITHFEVLERFPNQYALVKCRLETGRTHQIRMHLLEANAPIIGDALYGFKNTIVNRFIDRVALHAELLSFDWNGEKIAIHSEYPEDFHFAVEKLRAMIPS